MNTVADIVHDQICLRLVFHPHAETHVEYEDQIEMFPEQTDSDHVSSCFDIGHHAYRGGDAVNFMQRHHDRFPYLHLKSIDREVQKKVEADKIPFATAVGMDIFCEPSVGGVDFLAFRDVLSEIDYDGFAIVERDMIKFLADIKIKCSPRILTRSRCRPSWRSSRLD